MDLFQNPSARFLSVRHPWAHLIVAGVKPIENRPWQTSYRGPLLIHAGLKASTTPLAKINERYGIALTPDQFEFGGIVGVATLTDIVPPGRKHESPYYDGPVNDAGKANYGLVLTRPQRLPFFKLSGALMIRPAPAEALAFYSEALLNYARLSG